MNTIQLIPNDPLIEGDFLTHVQSAVLSLSDAVDEAANQAILDWEKQTGMGANAYMRDTMRQNLLSTVVGFLSVSRAHQLTPDHVEDYFKISTNKVPPRAGNPVTED
jgi:hypothetical protein